MARLLIVHHTPSPATEAVLDQLRAGAGDEAIRDVDVVVRAALGASAADVLAADGYLLATPANLGYISGALKHFFDQIYYPCRIETAGRPFGACIHGNEDTTGAERAIETITTGLGWRLVAEPLRVMGKPTPADLAACRDLGATVAARLALEAN